ncbi:MAG TPA: hypothetical protein VF355_05130 [Anaerolineaceae bacterium]
MMDIRQRNPVLTERGTFSGVMLLGLVVRLLWIASHPIWYDEAFAVLFAEKGRSHALRISNHSSFLYPSRDIHD